ncbi:MAG: AmmeMemoRadiSam system radical SAM enzyme [Deltaproteobacteria bacterium]
MKEAMYWTSDKGKVKCNLCPHNCSIDEGNIGICRVRRNLENKLYSLNYGKISSIALDPIEKKPLSLFFPGKNILSVGTTGCNLKCSFCQNWSIAHADPDTINVLPEQLVEEAIKLKKDGNIGIAFTYNEPSIWFEFVYETVKLSKQEGLKNVLVTNGFISIKPLEDILPYIDAMNIDVKAFNDDYYKDICKGRLEDIKKTVEFANEKCHVEVTTLIVPELNDNLNEIEQLASWLSSINPEIPIHFSRYFPNYKMKDKQPTPRETLEKAKKIAEGYLKYVYIGNI